MLVRVIDYRIDGHDNPTVYRLFTTLTDPAQAPAVKLAGRSGGYKALRADRMTGVSKPERHPCAQTGFLKTCGSMAARRAHRRKHVLWRPTN